MATREQIGEGAPSAPIKRRWRFPFPLIHRLEPGPGQELYTSALGPGWWKDLFKRPRRQEPGPDQELYTSAFSPDWRRDLFKRPSRPHPDADSEP